MNGTGLTLRDSGTFTNYGTLALKNTETLANFQNDVDHGTIMLIGSGSTTGLKTGSSYHHFNLNDGLVGYWKLDETSGTRAADSSGYGNSGSLVGPTISSTVAPVNFTNGRALSFDGSDDYVVLADSASLKPTTAITIATWVKPSTGSLNTLREIYRYDNLSGTQSTRHLFSFQNAGNCSGGGGTAGCIAFGISTGASYAELDVNISSANWENAWNYVVATYDGTTKRIYQNGVEIGNTGATGSIGQPSSATPNIGRSPTATEYFSGLIDDVRIYNRALSPGEIAALAAGNQPSTAKGTVTLNGNLDVDGDLTLNGGTLDVSSSNYGVTVGGSWENNGGIYTARDGTVTLDGTDSGLSILSGGTRFDKLSVTQSGEWTLADRLTASGALTISAGTLDVSTSNYPVKAGTLNQSAGTITPRNGRVILSGDEGDTAVITSTLNELRIEDPTEQGLVGYWKFDEGTNTGAILDSSGHGNTGVRHGGGGLVWTGSSLPTNIAFDNPYAMKFDGTDDYVDAPYNSAIDVGTGDFTVSLWAKTSNKTEYQTLFSRDNPANGAGIILYTAPTSGVFRTWVGSIALNGTIDIANGSWHHVVLVRTSGTIKHFVDGAFDVSAAATGNINQSNNNIVRFGKAGDGFYKLNGSLDDVRIYNRALSPAEIKNLYQGRYAAGGSGTSTVTLGSNLSTSSLALDSGNLSTSAYDLTVSSAFTLESGQGTLTLGSGTATFSAGLTLSGSTITGGAGTMDVNGDVLLNTGSLVAPSGTLTVSGDWTNTDASFDSNGGTVTFDGSGDQTLTPGGTGSLTDFSTLRVSKASGTLSLSGALSGALVRLSSGTFSAGANTVTAGALTIDGGTFAAGSGLKDING
ncbi:MAG: LamG-like jellyroll fold domain-containing protein, partial [Thermomicrobiales bacterium]